MPVRAAFLSGLLTIGLVVGSRADNVASVDVSGNRVRLMLGGGSAVDFTPANDNMVRVEYRQGNQNSAVSEIMDHNFSSSVSFTNVSKDGNPIVLTGVTYSVSIAKSPFAITFKNSQGTTLFTSSKVEQNALGGTVVSNATFYGGRSTRYYSQNNLQYNFSGSKPIFNSTSDFLRQGMASAPFLWTPKRFGVIVDAEDGTMTVNGTSLTVDRNGAVCQNKNNLFFLISGSPREIMASYYLATGRFPVPPRWTCGFFNSQWGFPFQTIQDYVTEYRNKDIPLDAYILDYDWFFYNNQNGTQDGDFKWNTNNFPTAMSGELKKWLDERGVKLVGIRKPHGAFAGGTWGNCADFYDANIRKMFWDKFVDPSWDSYARGIVAYWNDEADDCRNGDKPFMFLYMQKSQYEGQRSHATYKNNRVWSLNRSYLGGSQRYAYGLWSGDIKCDNQEMRDQRGYMLSAINTGAAWWGMDIGGFQSRPSDADYLHWMQFGAFVPVYRVHGNLNQEREPWLFGADAERVSKKYIQLRYSLIPYIYSGYWKLHRDGLPLVRSLVMDYPDDNNVAQNVDAWMFGEQILVSPVLEAYSATSKKVYVPKGNWVNFWNDAAVTGGAQVSIATGSDQIPVLVKQGAVIPRQTPGRWVDDPNVKDIAFHVYSGADGSFEYFDDDGLTYNYEKDDYCSIVLSHKSSGDMEDVNVAAKKGAFNPTKKSGSFVFHNVAAKPKIVAVQSGSILDKEVTADAFAAAAAPAWAYNSGSKTVSVKVEDPFAAGTIRIAQAVGTLSGAVGARAELDKIALRMLAGRTLSVVLPPTLAMSSGVNLQLVAANGAVIKSYHLGSHNASNISLSTQTWPTGVCLLRLTTGNATVTKRVIVVH
jgi:alpha-glucosidase